MHKFNHAEQLAKEIQVLSKNLVSGISDSRDGGYQEAKKRICCPINYMRYAEFEAVLKELDIKDGMKILDVSSPQWFSICLSNRNPGANFYYLNITDEEIVPFKQIAHNLGIKNLTFIKSDVRHLNFSDNTFDRIISISVIEHIFPEADGDLKALIQIKRVLKYGGYILLTVPFKSTGNIIFLNHSVYEREKNRRNFYAREYDAQQYKKLIENSGLYLDSNWHICEKKGFFSKDYYKYGPGKNTPYAIIFLNILKLINRNRLFQLELLLARFYLRVSKVINSRVVNICGKIVKDFRC